MGLDSPDTTTHRPTYKRYTVAHTRTTRMQAGPCRHTFRPKIDFSNFSDDTEFIKRHCSMMALCDKVIRRRITTVAIVLIFYTGDT